MSLIPSQKWGKSKRQAGLTKHSIRHIFQHIKAVTLHVEEEVYDRYKREARLRNRSASDLIREAMGVYMAELAPPERSSLLEVNEPAPVGKVLDLPQRRDLLDELLEHR